MRAIRVTNFGEPDVMRVADVPTPLIGVGDLLVRIHAAGINPVDTYIRSGTYARKPPLPYTPGIDGAGVVETIGAAVTRFVPGDRVYLSGSKSGTYAEFACCTEEDAHLLPPALTFEQGAALGIPFGTAYFALFVRGAAREQETVLIHGASGGVGSACVQLAHAAEMKVLGTAGPARGLELVQRLGADAVFNHGDPGYLEAIASATRGHGVDLIIEMLANRNLAHDLQLLAQSGRIVIVGNRGSIEINPREIMSRNADIRGVMLFATEANALQQIHADLRALIERGVVHPVIAHSFPLEEAPLAHQRIMAGGAEGKIVLIP
jgi:NADPH2:quinone reductase